MLLDSIVQRVRTGELALTYTPGPPLVVFPNVPAKLLAILHWCRRGAAPLVMRTPPPESCPAPSLAKPPVMVRYSISVPELVAPE